MQSLVLMTQRIIRRKRLEVLVLKIQIQANSKFRRKMTILELLMKIGMFIEGYRKMVAILKMKRMINKL